MHRVLRFGCRDEEGESGSRSGASWELSRGAKKMNTVLNIQYLCQSVREEEPREL